MNQPVNAKYISTPIIKSEKVTSKKYLYLTSGDATEAAYTAGKIVIKIHGAAFDYNND